MYFSFHLLLLWSAPTGEPITMYGNTRWSCGWVPCPIFERNFNYGISRKIAHFALIFYWLKIEKVKKCNNYTEHDATYANINTFLYHLYGWYLLVNNATKFKLKSLRAILSFHKEMCLFKNWKCDMFIANFSYNGSPFRNITSPYWRNVSCTCLESRWAGLKFFLIFKSISVQWDN